MKAQLRKAKELIVNIVDIRTVYSLVNAKEVQISEKRAYELGIVNGSELGLLKDLVEKANSLSGPIVEVGTLFGYSTRKIAQWKSQDKEFITVDNYTWNPFSVPKALWYKLVKKGLSLLVKNKNVIQLYKDKNEFYRTYSGEAPAMVFLDADHSYEQTKIDIDWAIGVRAKIICGHDYSDSFPGVKQAVNESGNLERIEGSLWVLSPKY